MQAHIHHLQNPPELLLKQEIVSGDRDNLWLNYVPKG
jgi:hypothetical protein